MYQLIEFKNIEILKDILKELKRYNQTPIILQKIRLTNKQEIQIQLENIRKIKNELKKNELLNNIILLEYFAIQIEIIKQDNSNIGLISNLNQEFDLTIGIGGLNKTNRFFLEDTQIDILQDSQNSLYKTKIDFIHHLNSGINHILCKFAKDKNINFLYTLNFTKTKNNYLIAKEIGRINQNIKFHQKYKNEIIINFIIQNKYQIKQILELKSISNIFNISTTQTENNMNNLEIKIKTKQEKQSKNYISKNIKILQK